MAKKKTRDAATVLDRMIGSDRALRQMVAEEEVNAQVARMIYAARTAAKLTQAQLARKIGTSQPVIARLEDADYEGHSLTMLKRIAEKLGKRIVIRLSPAVRRRHMKAPAIA